jgi:hypothetical protein
MLLQPLVVMVAVGPFLTQRVALRCENAQGQVCRVRRRESILPMSQGVEGIQGPLAAQGSSRLNNSLHMMGAAVHGRLKTITQDALEV